MWSKLLTPYIDSNIGGYGRTQDSGLQIHYFEFKANSSKKVTMSYKFNSTEPFLYPHPIEQFLNVDGRAEIKGQQYTVNSMKMTAGENGHPEYTICLQGNDGMRTFSTPQEGIVMFPSEIPDIKLLGLHPISEGYTKTLTNLEKTIASLKIHEHAEMVRLDAFHWWDTFIQEEKLVVKMSDSEYRSNVDSIRWCARSVEKNPERYLRENSTSISATPTSVELFSPVTHERWKKNTLRKCVKALSVSTRTGKKMLDSKVIRYGKGSFGIARFEWSSSTPRSDRQGFHLRLCLIQFTEDITNGDIEDQGNTDVLWFRSTAKSFNGQWRKWLVRQGKQTSRNKRQKNEAEWISKIPVADIVTSVNVNTYEDGAYVKISAASIRAVEEYEASQNVDSDSEEEGLH